MAVTYPTLGRTASSSTKEMIRSRSEGRASLRLSTPPHMNPYALCATFSFSLPAHLHPPRPQVHGYHSDDAISTRGQ